MNIEAAIGLEALVPIDDPRKAVEFRHRTGKEPAGWSVVRTLGLGQWTTYQVQNRNTREWTYHLWTYAIWKNGRAYPTADQRFREFRYQR